MNHARFLIALILGLLPTAALAQVTVTPSLLDFGQIQMGASQQILRAWVQNTGTTTVNVQTRDRVGSVDFRIDRFVNLALLPGRQAALDIAFRPLSPGLKAGYVRLTWAGGQADVQLRADVVTAPPPPPPPPPPPTGATVTGKVSGTGIDTLAPGQRLTVTRDGLSGTLEVTAVTKDDTTPQPQPDPGPTPAEGWFVSPTGRATGAGTQIDPWDLRSTINGTRRGKLAGGGLVWLLGGTYRIPPAENLEGLGYRCVVGGTAANPLVFRSAPGEHVTIDGGWSFFQGSSHTWLRDVDVTVSDLVMGKPPFGLSGSWPEGAPNGGVSFYTSSDCKVINCRIYRNRQGINLWTEAQRAEAYGNIIFDNGWIGSDRAHGHGIYCQSPASTTKRIENNIITHTSYSRGWPDGRYGLHGYGERVAVTNITVEGNLGAGSNDAWLLDDGAVLGPSTGHHFVGNAVYGVRVRLGSRPDQPLEFRNNVVAGELQISAGPEVTRSNNLVSPPDPRPSNDQVILRANRYEPARAHLMLIDFNRDGKVTVDASGWLGAAERVRLVEPTDFWGAPVFSGAWPAGGVSLPVDGARILVAIKDGLPGVAPPATIASRFEEAPVTPRLRR